MPSWGRSFVVASKAWIVGLLLGLVFTIVFGFIGYTMILKVIETIEILPYEPYIQIDYGAAVFSIIPIVIGALLASLSAYAVLVKYVVEESVKEVGFRAPPSTPPSAAPTRICPQCGRPVAPKARFCVHCGAKLAST